jgi:hypothetical protein
MRNYSHVASNDSVFLVPADQLSNPRINRRIWAALVLTLEATEGSLTPSEERVLADFLGWSVSVENDLTRALITSGGYTFAPCFSYHNINTGKSVIVMASVQEYDCVVYPRML